jgi:hypothetical protein
VILARISRSNKLALQRIAMTLTHWHAIGSRLPVTMRFYTTLEHNRQMTTSAARGEKQCV